MKLAHAMAKWKLHSLVAVLAVGVLPLAGEFSGAAKGEDNWILLENFEGRDRGTVHGSGLGGDGWKGVRLTGFTDHGNAAVDSFEGNQVFRFNGLSRGESRGAVAPLGNGNTIADGKSGTLFFRLYATGPSLNQYIGLSPEPTTTSTRWGFPRYKPRLAVSSLLAGMPGGTTANTEKWLNVWMVIENAQGTDSDSVRVYVTESDSPQAPTQLDRAPSASLPDGNAFRSGGTTETLRTLFFYTDMAANSNLVYVDDIHFSQGVNLTNPIPKPPAHGTIFLGGMVLVPLLRRKK